jgi:hypothetical protein
MAYTDDGHDSHKIRQNSNLRDGDQGEHKKVGGIMLPSALVCWCLHRTEVWIPFPEGLVPVLVEDLSSDLQ